MKFSSFNLDPDLQDGINAIGFDEATPIQQQAIPIIMKGQDLIGCAQTGTGKTAAFLLPLIHQIVTAPQSNSISAIILVPTRELAVQIDQQLEGLAYFAPISSLAIYGGRDGTSFTQEKTAVSQGADIIIATPGRFIAHLTLGYVKTGALKAVVLDEADRMLDMGFYNDIMRIINQLPKQRQSLLFSATMPPKIRKLANQILTDYQEINIAVSKPAAGIIQAAFMVYDEQKVDLVQYLLKDDDVPSVIIFSSTKKNVDKTARALKKIGLSVAAIHSDLDQQEREQVLLEFRNKQLTILVATDILARGIDVEDISMVINFDVPGDAADYVHRIGRTARAASSGEAITFINDKEQNKFSAIEQLIETEVRKVPLPPGFEEGPKYKPNRARKKKGGYKKKKYYKKKR